MFYCPICAHKRAVLKAMKAKELRLKFKNMSSRVSVGEEDNVGDFQGGSPFKRYKKTTQRIPAVQRESSPSRKSPSGCEAEDVVAENGEERIEKDQNDESSKVRRSQTLNLHERVTPEEFDFNRVVEWDHNEKDTDYISAELIDIPEPSRNEKGTNNVSSESREILALSQNEKATEVLPKSTTQVPDSNQNVETSSSTQPINVPEFVSDEILFKRTERRKINWTAEELKELKAGVQHFSMQMNKNIPWRKILLRGKDIFHKTRTPQIILRINGRSCAKKPQTD